MVTRRDIFKYVVAIPFVGLVATPKRDLLRTQIYNGRDWDTLEVNYGDKDKMHLD